MKSVIFRTNKCVCVEDGEQVTLCLTAAPYFINATVASMLRTKDACGDCLCTYYLDYDETQTAPCLDLASTDLKGLIKRDCLVEYIEFLTGVS